MRLLSQNCTIFVREDPTEKFECVANIKEIFDKKYDLLHLSLPRQSVRLKKLICTDRNFAYEEVLGMNSNIKFVPLTIVVSQFRGQRYQSPYFCIAKNFFVNLFVNQSAMDSGIEFFYVIVWYVGAVLS